MNEANESFAAADGAVERHVGTPTYESGFAFGRFRFDPLRHLLVGPAGEVKLGGRTATILHTLLARAGKVVGKSELLRIVWPSTIVEEGNLRVQIAALRRILSDGAGKQEFITSVVGQGYVFVAHVERIGSVINRGHVGPEPSSRLTSPLAKVFGREVSVESISQLLAEQRLVTLVGAGGIGKTTVALAASQTLRNRFEGGCYFVDFATISEPSLVPFAVASALGMSAETDTPLESLVAHLRNKEVFLLLDNCEHIVDSAAALAESLLRGVPGLRVLATSHEPLRAEGEWIFRLPPLPVPSADAALRYDQALAYPSFELFVDRATSDNQVLKLDDSDVPFIIEICRKLDGIPLAIEIAAAQVEVFGIAGLAERLEDRLDAFTSGRRTAATRHQTIRNMLDWSHENLTECERVILRRLSIFVGHFSLEAATMVAGDERLSTLTITDGVASLVRKSLLYPNAIERSVTYRLLESTRLYASDKLLTAGEHVRMRRLHLQFAIDILERAEKEWQNTRREVWLQKYSGVIDDVRQALGWAFSSEGDAAAGVRLSALAVALGLQLGLVDEFRDRAETALTHALKLKQPELLSEMQLNVFYAILNANQVQPQDHHMAGLARAAHLAELADSDRYRIQPLFLKAGLNMGMGNYPVALEHIEKVAALGRNIGDDLAILGSQRMMAQIVHFNGQNERAIELANTVLAHPVINIPLSFGGVQTDRRVSMRIILARALWLRGNPDEALDVMREAIRIAPEDGPLASCQALSQAALPLLFWRGEWDSAQTYIDDLIERSSRYTMKHWHSWGQLYQAILVQKKQLPTEPMKDLNTEGDLQIHTLATITGQLTGLDFSDKTFVQKAGWAAPELLRLRGELLAQCEELDSAESVFLESISLARSQGALAWELRTATSLAKLKRIREPRGEAFDILSSAYERFSEGLATADLVAASILLSSWH